MAQTTGGKWTFLMVALLGGIAGGAIGSRWLAPRPAIASDTAPKSLAAQEILLVDAHGRTHAALRLDSDFEPVLQMYGHSGKSRVALGFGKERNLGLLFTDDAGVTRVIIGVTNDDVPAVRLFDQHGRQRALFGVDSGGESALDFYDGNGRLLRELP